MPAVFVLLRVLASLALCAVAATDTEVALPHFKWGQTWEKLFVTIAVKDLDLTSVSFDFRDGGFSFKAADLSGTPHGLDLDLVLDIDASDCHWEHLQRPDRWGVAVLVTLRKRFPDRWESFLEKPGPYKKVMDRDWAREDQVLEPLEEDAFFEEHRKQLPRVSEADVQNTLGNADVLVLVVRHAACKQCVGADDNFAAVAKQFRSKGKSWKSRVRLGVVDARRDRFLARRLGARCATQPTNCRYYFVQPGGPDQPLAIKGRHDENILMSDLKRLARRQFGKMNHSSAYEGREKAERGLVVIPAGASQDIQLACHAVRLRMDVAVADGWELPSSSGNAIVSAVAWSPFDGIPSLFDGVASELEQWLRVRAEALLPVTAAFEDEDPYVEMGLPVARLWLNSSENSSLPVNEAARATVRAVAHAFLGRIAFVERSSKSKIHDSRGHGMPPGRFPAFGVATSTEFNSTRFGFLASLRPAAGDLEFWSGEASRLIPTFLEDALAGRVEKSYPSEATPEETGEPELEAGAVQRFVGRQCRDVVQSSDSDALIEVYDEWRRDHEDRTLRLDLLAPILARWNITVYRFDFGHNECPADGLPIIPAGYSGYYWVPRRAKERRLKFQKLKKLDPPFEKVLNFVLKHSEGSVKAAIPDILAEHEEAVQKAERWRDLQRAVVGRSRKEMCVAAVVGLGGIAAFVWLGGRWRSRKEVSGGPAASDEGQTSTPTPVPAGDSAAAEK